MHKAVLLLDTMPVRQVDFGVAMLDYRLGRLNQMHRVLPVETGADALSEIRIGNRGHGVALRWDDRRTLS